MTMTEEAKREVELFKKKQDIYGQMCADSALRAFISMANDNHSGFSWNITTHLLTRLLNDLPLTPIVDEDFLDQEGITQEDPRYLKEQGLKSHLSCNRMCSVFRKETLDGKVAYHDVDRVVCYDEEDPKKIPFISYVGSELVDKMFPITMPYYPPVEKYIVMLKDDKPIWVKTPEGEKIMVNENDK